MAMVERVPVFSKAVAQPVLGLADAEQFTLRALSATDKVGVSASEFLPLLKGRFRSLVDGEGGGVGSDVTQVARESGCIQRD